MEALAQPFQSWLKKPPAISAITCYYTPNEPFPYAALDAVVGDILYHALENGLVEPDRKLTKKGTQALLPLPIAVQMNGQTYQLTFRVRHQSFTKNSRTHGNFMNQMCFFFLTPDGKSKCFKVFRNGVVHVTGFNVVEEMHAATLSIIHAMAAAAEPSQTHTFTWKNVSICMMNLSFKLCKSLALIPLCSQIKSQTDWFAVYEPELYCGLMLDAGTFKACLFQSGSIILTAVKSKAELAAAFQSLMGFLVEQLDGNAPPQADSSGT